MERFSSEICQALKQVLGDQFQNHDLEVPPDKKMGDFAFPCFRLSKALKQPPPKIAIDLAGKISAAGTLSTKIQMEQAGPYLNFRITKEALVEEILGSILSGAGLGNYGQSKANSGPTWVLEYSSPNVAKPFQIYHLRGTVLGAALDRVGRYRGNKVISVNHLGDWGTQYGKLAIAIKKYGIPENPTIQDLVGVYVQLHQDIEKDPSLEDQAREAFLKLEQGDAEMKKLWQKCVDISLVEFDRTYSRLGVKFDHIMGESFYQPYLKPLLDELKAKNIAVESEGAWIVPLVDENGNEMTPCILQRSDSATIYATRDVAAAIYRHKNFHFDRMTYIVGKEQILHFRQIFGVLKKMGQEWVKNCEHVPNGLYRFKDSKMSTRKGNVFSLEETIEIAKERVKEVMTSRAQASEDPNRVNTAPTDELCEKIALGAILFNDLSSDPTKDVEFDLESMLDFEGETGPYLQYAHTRCLSILRKAETERGLKPQFSANQAMHMTKDEELMLLRTLGHFSLHLERTLTHCKPSHLCTYLIQIVKDFGAFYRECHVLSDDKDLTQARLMLVDATRRVLGRGLSLLGIPLPEKM